MKFRRADQLERESAHRRHHRAAARFHPDGQRPVDECRAVPAGVVAYRGGSPVRLEELGNIIDRWKRQDRVVVLQEWQQRPAIILAIQRQPGTNTITVTDA